MTLVNESCSPEWKVYSNSFVSGAIHRHREAKTLQQCQYACVFNPDCVAVAWYLSVRCYMFTNPLVTISIQQNSDVYELVKRCNITAGLLFIDTVFKCLKKVFV